MKKYDFFDFDNYNRLSPEEPVSSSLYLNEIVKHFNIDFNNPVHLIENSWVEIAGENFSKSVHFNFISDNTLYVKCKNSSVSHLFRLQGKEILKKINSLFPELHLNKVYVTLQ